MFAVLVQALCLLLSTGPKGLWCFSFEYIQPERAGILFIGERLVPRASPTGLASKPIDICLLAPIGPTVGPSYVYLMLG